MKTFTFIVTAIIILLTQAPQSSEDIFNALSFSSLCYSQGISTVDLYSGKIDSLITVKKISKEVLLVKFGADAVAAINTSRGIIVIDAGISSELTTRYRKIIEKKFGKKGFAYLINSHAHPDHCGGNSVFESSIIVGHKNGIDELSELQKNVGKRKTGLKNIADQYESDLQKQIPGSDDWNEVFTQRTRYRSAYHDAKNGIPFKLPDLTFSDTLNINSGNMNLEMFYFGLCHSKSDILIYIPQLKILFTGDLFSRYGHISINSELTPDNKRWERAVKWIQKRISGIDKIISGHGQILSTEDLNKFIHNIPG